MDVNMDSVVKHKKANFKFISSSVGTLLNIHHTINNENDGTVVRIRFTAAGFSANNERLIAVDHRENLFVFDLVSQQYWLLPEQLKRIIVVEGISGGNLVACGNKEGIVYFVDLDEKQRTVQLKVHNASVLGLALSAKPSVVHSSRHMDSRKNTSRNAFERTEPRYLLVTSQHSAKVYLVDGLTEVSSIDYGLSSTSFVHMYEWNWFCSSRAPCLISHSASGIIKVYRVNFKLIKELNVVRLIKLYLKNTSAQMITFESSPHIGGVGGGSDSPNAAFDTDDIGPMIKRITDDTSRGRINATQVTEDGRYYTVLCNNNTLAFFALESWLVCRVLVFSNLFIRRYVFLPNPSASATGVYRWATTTNVLVAQTVDNDLMLANFGQYTNKHSPTIRSLALSNLQRSESKCYKFRSAPNGRMLATVLKSGEVLLHSLDVYLQASLPGMTASVGILPIGEKTEAEVSGAMVRSQSNYYGKSAVAGSSSSGRTIKLYGSDCGTSDTARTRDLRKVKIERQMDAIHSQIANTLPKERLLRILKEYGEYPAKYRSIIWRTLLDLPGNTESFGALLQRGLHPCVASYDRRFSGHDLRTVRNLKKIVSCLCHWCPVFGLIDYLPSFVLPFVRHQPNDALTLFETVATILLNQCQLWFEFSPLEPFNYLAMVENVLAEYEPRLMSFYRSHSITSRTYAVPLMETAFSGCHSSDQWTCLWDHVLSNETYFPVFLIAAYNGTHRGTIMGALGDSDTRTADSIANIFHQSSPVDVRRLLRRAYDLMERCPDAIHPRNYFKSFIQLSDGSGGRVPAETRRGKTTYSCTMQNGMPIGSAGLAGRKACHSTANNAIDFIPLGPLSPSSGRSSVGTAVDEYASSATEGSTRTYVNFCNFPKALTEVRCSETNALQAEQRRLEAKIIELEKLEHSLKDRMVNNLIRQEHEQRVKKVERNFEEAISREEERIEMQRKLLLLHRKQLRERESELSLDLHNVKLINDATVRERELETVLKKFQRERQREETDLLFAEEDIKLKELELLARYQNGMTPVSESATSDARCRPDHQRYHQALEQLAMQKQKLYDEIDRTYTSLGMPRGDNEYTYRTVAELRKVASLASNERYPPKKENITKEQPTQKLANNEFTSQVKLYEDTIQRMEEQVKVLQGLKNDSTKRTSTFQN